LTSYLEWDVVPFRLVPFKLAAFGSLPQPSYGCLWYVVETNPAIRLVRTREVYPPDLVAFFREFGINAVGVHDLTPAPIDFGSFRVNTKPSFFFGLFNRSPQ